VTVHDPAMLKARLEQLAGDLPYEVTTRPMMGGTSATPTGARSCRSRPVDSA